MDVTCSAVPCPVILSATCVFYQGANLVYTGINNNDNLEIALQKIDAKFQDAGLGYIFQNGIIQLGPGLPVGLGGSLTQDTLITGAHKLSFSGELEASKLITTGGTSSQFVKGDGSLDYTAYQPTGNYISSLSGDGVANGPGSAIFTLANTGVIANTYGSATRVPIITVDAKGRVTNLTSTLIAVPSSLLLFGGDVTGSGNTGSSVTLTLQTVNPNPQPSNTFLKFAVNGKGLVTSTAPITNLDIESVLGYIPVPNTRTITINGITQNLAANRTWTLPVGGLVLTTTGTSGPATLIVNTLNIPQYTDQFTGTVTSVGLSMPSAFTVTNSPVTSSGTLTVTGAGTSSQYIRGDGQLATLPSSPSGGGASISYYLNGSIPSSVATYEQMSKTPVLGTGTDYTTSSNGLIAQFLTDVGDPAVINIPGGSWLVDLYFSVNSAGGSPNFYVELHKYDGSTFTLIASSVANAELITNGTAVDLYTTSLAVPTTTLTLTDRLAIRVYVDCDGKTLTLHTEDNNLAQIVTTFSTGISALNGLITQVQFLSTGTTGTDFNINSATNTHTFNLPVASATNTGKLSSTDWTTFNGKQNALSGTGIVKSTAGTISYLTDNTANWDTAYNSRINTFTTTGSSGSATFNTNTLNIPTYTLSGLGGEPAITPGTISQYWRGDKTWQTFPTAGWGLTGNAGTSGSTNFVGTTDLQNFIIKTNNGNANFSVGGGNNITDGSFEAIRIDGTNVNNNISIVHINPNSKNIGNNRKLLTVQGAGGSLQIAADGSGSINTLSVGSTLTVTTVQSAVANIFRLTNSTELIRFDLINQSVLIGTNTNLPSSQLTMNSTTKGFLPPRMTTTQRDAIATPAEGLIVYNTTTQTQDVRRNANWSQLFSSKGNSGLSASTDFIGTTDAVDFVQKANNRSLLRLSATNATADTPIYIQQYFGIPAIYPGAVAANSTAFSLLLQGTNTFINAPNGNTILQGSGISNGYFGGLYSNIAKPMLINEAATGTTAPAASSLLDLTSTTKGFLPPRMTNAQRTAIASPAIGLMVYCTDAVEGLYIYKSTGWTFIV